MNSIRIIILAALTGVIAFGMPAPAARAGGCGTIERGTCGVAGSQTAGNFHGIIAVNGSPWVLADAARDGTKPGCGDCSWSIVLACPTASPGDPGSQGGCKQDHSAECHRRQLLYRIYLTTATSTDQIMGTICLGGAKQPIPIGDDATADVERYLKNVTPPDLDITTKPKRATLAGLKTYFTAAPPATLKPAPFGGPDITEAITIVPSQADWRWGDASTSGWTSAKTTVTHSYLNGGVAHGRVSTRWGATYTITYQGQTFGPYDATGRLTKQQTFALPVDTSTPTLVSH